MKTIKLFYRSAAENADKVYAAQIVDAGGREYAVNFQFGKRGSRLARGTKTRIPVSLALAENIFAKLVKEKTGNGYVETPDGTPFAGDADKLGEILPHPRKTIVSAAELQSLIASGGGICQRKYDGTLSRLDIGGGTVLLGERMTRKSGGFYTSDDLAMFERFPQGWFAAFTVETWNGENVLNLPEHRRFELLKRATLPAGAILAEAVDDVKGAMASGAEGVVWRDWQSAWGLMTVHKANSIYTCRVSSMDGRQSVGIVDAETGIDRGRLTLNGGACDKVRVGSIVRCEAMAEHDGGKLRQAAKCTNFLVSY